MSIACPINLDVEALREDVRRTYDQVASNPQGDFHFHRGPEYAARQLDYDAEELASLPTEATRSFAGVTNPLSIEPLQPSDVVLDVGSGAGTDLLLAARRVRESGRVIGVDMTESMLNRARAAAAADGLDNVELRQGLMEELPVDDNSIDVVISNGVLNLAPDKDKAFSEIARVLKPGGRLLLGDIIIEHPLSEDARNNIDLWAA